MATGRRTVGIIFTLSIFQTCLPQIVGSPFRIRLTNRITNTITLQCQLIATDQPNPNAMFFLNGTSLENFTELQRGEDHGVSFQIRRDLEGYFTCGNDSSMSNQMALITIPDSMLRQEPLPVYAILGEQVQLNCIIPPGHLLQQYSVTWDRAGTVIYQSRNSPPTLDDRYSIDPSDFSLIIDNVQLEDASKAYHCLLTVADPNVMQTYEYTNLQFYDIRLIVLAVPVINEPPSENITIEGHNASFICSVRGFPDPVVEWELNGMLLSSDRSTNHSRQDGNYMITSSALMITSVTFEMNGLVRCIGRTSSTLTGDRVLDDATSTTTLVVYSPPSIDRSRLRNSIVAEGENTSFVCSAQGYPAPMVTWFLNGTQVLPQDLGKDLEVYNRSSQSGPYNVTTSRLLITSAQQRLNVEVQCLASSTTAEIYLPDDSKTVQLVVLGSFDLSVDVTRGGNVLFEVTLHTPLSKPVNLILEYVNLNNPLRRKNFTTNVAYIAKTSFLHLEPSLRVPFDRFRVSVRLTSSFIIGPPVEDANDRAKNRPTLVDPNVLNLERHKHNLWGAIFGGVVFSVLVFVLLCCISCLCYKAQMTRIILSKPEKLLETYIEQIRCESNSEDIRKELIKKANKLARDIISYRSERQHSTNVTSDNSQEKKTTLCCCVKCFYTKSSATPSNRQGNNGTELTRIRPDCDSPAKGPPPPPPSTGAHPSPQPHSATGSENQTEVSQGSTASLVDEALDAFVRDLRHITE